MTSRLSWDSFGTPVLWLPCFHRYHYPQAQRVIAMKYHLEVSLRACSFFLPCFPSFPSALISPLADNFHYLQAADQRPYIVAVFSLFLCGTICQRLQAFLHRSRAHHAVPGIASFWLWVPENEAERYSGERPNRNSTPSIFAGAAPRTISCSVSVVCPFTINHPGHARGELLQRARLHSTQ